MKGFWFVKGRLLRAVYKTFDNGNFLVCKKKADFTAHAKPLGEEKLLLAKKVGVFSSCKANR